MPPAPEIRPYVVHYPPGLTLGLSNPAIARELFKHIPENLEFVEVFCKLANHLHHILPPEARQWEVLEIRYD